MKEEFDNNDKYPKGQFVSMWAGIILLLLGMVAFALFFLYVR